MYDKSPARGINFTLIKWIPQFWCEKIVKLYIMLINNIIRNGNVIGKKILGLGLYSFNVLFFFFESVDKNCLPSFLGFFIFLKD